MTSKVNYVRLLLFLSCFLIVDVQSIDYSNPITPQQFQSVAAQGFATNYFKTDEPAKKYKEENIQDVYDAGFRNLRLRCIAEHYPYPYNTTEFETFLTKLEEVVDKCLSVGIVPIVSWVHHDAEAWATDEDRENYVIWWKKVAEKLKNKDYRLVFNLFTELGVDKCGDNCGGSLKLNITKYYQWTTAVMPAIRGTGGNNENRILILGSPKKTAKGLELINSTLYENQTHKLMVEHHVYASGANNNPESPKYWVGNGTTEQRQTLIDELDLAKNSTPLLTYFGAWMPQDNKDGEIDQDECGHFSKYFVETLKDRGIPWSLNVLDVYYRTQNKTWLTGIQDIQGAQLNMSKVLDVIKANM